MKLSTATLMTENGNQIVISQVSALSHRVTVTVDGEFYTKKIVAEQDQALDLANLLLRMESGTRRDGKTANCSRGDIHVLADLIIQISH